MAVHSNSSNTQPPHNNPPNTKNINLVHHPLFFLQNDHPGLVLISKKLTGSYNYSSWKISMMISLSAKNNLKLINGKFEEPAIDSPIRPFWERSNDMVSNEIAHLKQGNTTIELYYHKLKGLWDELDALEVPYACVCRCDCTNGRTNGEMDQKKRLVQFLMGLDESYTNVRSQIFKKGHKGDECYKIVGYPPGHPLYNKYIPPSQRTHPPKHSTANLTIINDETSKLNNLASSSIDPFVHSRMDQLTNQLNQVLLMLQNNPKDFTAFNMPHMSGRYTFIAAFKSNVKEIRIIDGGATDHIYITLLRMHDNQAQCKWKHKEIQSKSYMDTSLFTITYNGTITSLLVYVDDILLISKDGNFIKEIKTKKKYALELIECADVLDIKPVATTIKLNDSDSYLLPDPSTYKTLVGKLLYLTIVKPDLSFATQALSQYSHSPRSSHYEALLRVLKYIKLCPEAEYRALADSTCEISWLKCLLLDLRVHVPTPSLVMCDNASTIALANNPVHHARTKHIENDCHFVRD
nr:retrovirus-related Pol polyprotein from transposon TNT 1-94 [Tanacetum cinerariifolium]